MQSSATIEGFRLSPQQTHWWRTRAEVGCRVGCVIAVEGEVDPERLRRAVERVVARHEILRTRFEALAGMEFPIQVIGDEPTVTILSAGSGEGEEAAGDSLAGRVTIREDPAAGRTSVRVDLPAIRADHASLDQLLREIARAYGGREPEGSVGLEDSGEEPLQYLQFSEWQNEIRESEDAEEGEAFWHRTLEDMPRPPALPCERDGGPDAPGVMTRLSLPVGEELAAGLDRLAEASGVSRGVVLLACFEILLARLTGERRVRVDVLFDGRRFDELEEAVGLFAGHLPVALELDAGDRLAACLAAFGRTVEEVDEWQDFFDAEAVGDASPVCFEESGRLPEESAGGARFRMLERTGAIASAKLSLVVLERPEGLELTFDYDPGLYGEASLARLLGQYRTLLAGLDGERRLGELELLGEAERRQLVVEWNDTAAPPVHRRPLHELVAERARQTPAAPAVLGGGEELTFAELAERARAVAGELGRRGLEPEERVALFMERSADLVAGALGILEAGGAFVALELWQPAERLRTMLKQAGGRRVVTRSRHRALLAEVDADLDPVCVDALEAGGSSPSPAVAPGAVAPGAVAPGHLAYCIFTSGSTGTPKGVLVEHRSVTNLLDALAETVYRDEDGPLRVAVNAPLSFDASIKQLIQLARGHALVMVPEEIRPDGEAMLAFLAEQRVDVLDTTPSQLRVLLDAGLSGSEHPRVLLVGGEAIDRALWRRLADDPRWRAPRRRAWNVYGPTECTVDVTVCPIAGERRTPSLGRPLRNVRAYVTGADLRPVAGGFEGELHVAGAGLARGYVRQPARTAERFLPDPFAREPGGRLYATGDRVRTAAGGGLEYVGRRDHQVKLRGLRIELGEIEALLAAAPGVSEAVALLRHDPPGDPRLVAYAARQARFRSHVDGRRRHLLPNGMAVVEQNPNETGYLYQEIFEGRCYARHGIRLPDDAVVVDVGANIGMFSLFVGRHRPRARIYAFEPLPALFETATINADLYAPGARLFPFGLSASERDERFTFYPRYTMMSGQSVYADPESEVEVIKRFLDNERRQGAAGAEELLAEAEELLAGRFDEEVCEVRLRRLSDVWHELGLERVDLLKIDVQRAEMDVLAGLDDEHWPRVDQIVMEVHDAPGEATAGRVGELRALLEKRGFEVVVEQDELLAGTDRYNLWAWRPGRREGGEIGAREAVRAIDEAGVEVSPASLRELLQASLPEPMVPAAIVVLDELPLTRRGKVDREALPLPEDVLAEDEQLTPPRTPFEEMLLGLWQDVLATDRLGVDDSFFARGGHSLLATQLMSRVREAFDVELPLRTLFEAPTVAGLAARVEGAVQRGAGVEAPPIEAAEGPRGDLPLSFTQQRLWFFDQLLPGSPIYNSPKAVILLGVLDVAALERAWNELARRHEVLRTRFPAEAGQPRQVIEPRLEMVLGVVDLSGIEDGRRRAVADGLSEAEAVRPFDLARGPLMRAGLLRLSSDEHLLLLTMHHIASDAWSLGILVRELAVLYEAFAAGRPSPLPELAVQYADFAAWQRSWLQGEVLERELDYWRRQLGGELPGLGLATDRPRGPVEDPRGGQELFRLPDDTAAAVAELARAEGATLFMVLLAAFQTLLSRHSGQEDVIVGVPVAGRDRLEIEGLIGCFINMLPMRADLSGNPTFREVLRRVRSVALQAYAHQHVPFEKLVEELQPDRRAGETPFFQVALGVQNAAQGEPLEISGLTLRPASNQHESVRYDLTLWLFEGPGTLAAAWTYRAALFDGATIKRLHGRFEKLLALVGARPDVRLESLELLSEEEKAELARRKKSLKDAGRQKFMAIRKKSQVGA